MTSDEAAALYISEGRTKDPAMASMIANGEDLNLDALQRAHLRRLMGFDFAVKVRPNKIHVFSKEEPHVSTYTKLGPDDIDENGDILSEKAVDKLVDACFRLKKRWEDNAR